MQEDPTAGFQETNCALVMPYLAAIAAQVSPDVTKWKVLQLLVIPSWIGVGVAMPFPGAVGEGLWPRMEMQTYYNGTCQQRLGSPNRKQDGKREASSQPAPAQTYRVKPQARASVSHARVP